MDRDEEPGAPGQRGSIAPFLIMATLLFMLTNHSGEEYLAQHQYQDAIQSLRFQKSNYTAWINGTDTNFTMPAEDPTVPPLFHLFDALGTPLDPSIASRYSNVTGFLRGDAAYRNITPSYTYTNESERFLRPLAGAFMRGMNETDVIERQEEGSWNWTASTRVGINLVEKNPIEWSTDGELLRLIHGRIELVDVNTEEELRFEFEGVHAVNNGSIYGMAEPAGRHVDIRLLPSILPVVYQNDSAQAIVRELASRLTKLEALIDAGSDVSPEEPANKAECPFTLYGKIESNPIPQAAMTELEQEIQEPTGIWTVPPPMISLSGIMISRECGILFELTNAEGLRSQTFLRKVITYSGLAAVFYLVLLILLQRQIQISRTPSGIPRASRWTFLTQGVVDSLSFASHVTFAILSDGRTSLALIAPAFLACMLFVHETQFAMLLQHVQIPDSPPAPVQAPPPPVRAPPPVPSSILPPTTFPPPPQVAAGLAPIPTSTPTTSPSGTVGFLRAFVRHLLTDPSTRIWIAMVASVALLVRIMLTPWMGVFAFALTYSSFWMPQIVRSARRGRSSGLTIEYLVGTTICRLFFAFYFLTYPANVLDIEPRPWTYLLASFVGVQVAVVILQDRLGPSFFLPSHYTAAQTTYDYHPPMPIPDAEAPEQSLGDCAICMDTIVLEHRPSEKLSEANERLLHAVTTGSGGRKNYSLAPCHHLFHTECLERWLAIKNICPQCRRPLPPL